MPSGLKKIVPKHPPHFLVKRTKRYRFSAKHRQSNDERQVDDILTNGDSRSATLRSVSSSTMERFSTDRDNSLHSMNRSTLTPVTGIFPLKEQSSTSNLSNGEYEKEGWLDKWTNYWKGYQKRWFVLRAGVLFYYRSRDDVAQTCRGTVYLKFASISDDDSHHFTISSGSTILNIRVNSEAEHDSWVTVLKLAKENASKQQNHRTDSDEDSSQANDSNTLEPISNLRNMGSKARKESIEFDNMHKIFEQKLEDIKVRREVANRHHRALQRALNELAELDESEATIEVIKHINQSVQLFHVTSTTMTSTCEEAILYLKNNLMHWQKTIRLERDARLRMEKICEEVAAKSVRLEKQIQRVTQRSRTTASGSRNDSSSSDHEYFDASSDPQTVSVFRVPLQTRSSNDQARTSVIIDEDISSSGDEATDDPKLQREHLQLVVVKKSDKSKKNADIVTRIHSSTIVATESNPSTKKRKRRMKIPERPNHSINLWSIVRNSVGKDLSKIPVPVNFSEPLSLLQRVTEELEYSSILDHAAQMTDYWEQLALVAAFTVSSYSTTSTRVNKPFNPLLGETFECDRTDDLGWRSMSEQVSHHPPIFATHVEGSGWTLYQEFTMSSKFRAQYLSITPLGHSHLIFKNNGHHFTWRKVTTVVNNIIVGKLWIDNVGEMDIINHTTKDVCKLKYFPYSYFSSDSAHKVTGVITDVDQKPRWVLSGTWTEKIDGGPVNSASSNRSHSTRMETSDMRALWVRKMPPSYMTRMHNFTELAVQLNEFEEGVAPTDSRRRPDQRLMEDGLWDEANEEKIRLEEKQRQARRQRETASGGHDNFEPKWFVKQHDPLTKTEMHVFTNEYWACKAKQDWSRCDDIF